MRQHALNERRKLRNFCIAETTLGNFDNLEMSACRFETLWFYTVKPASRDAALDLEAF